MARNGSWLTPQNEPPAFGMVTARPTPRDLLYVSSFTSACRRSMVAITFHIWRACSRHHGQMRRRLVIKEWFNSSGRILYRCFSAWAVLIFCTEGGAEVSTHQAVAKESRASLWDDGFWTRTTALLNAMGLHTKLLVLREVFQGWSFLLLWRKQHCWHQKLREEEREVQTAWLEMQEAQVEQQIEEQQLQQRIVDLETVLQARHDWMAGYEEQQADRFIRLRRHCLLTACISGQQLSKMWVWSLWRFALLPRSRLLPQAQRLESRYRAMALLDAWAAWVALQHRRHRTQGRLQEMADHSRTWASNLLHSRLWQERTRVLWSVVSAWRFFTDFRVALGKDAAFRVGLRGESFLPVAKESSPGPLRLDPGPIEGLEDLLEDANSVMQESLLLPWKPFLSALMQLWRAAARTASPTRSFVPHSRQRQTGMQNRAERSGKLLQRLLQQIDRALLVVVICAWKLQVAPKAAIPPFRREDKLARLRKEQTEKQQRWNAYQQATKLAYNKEQKRRERDVLRMKSEIQTAIKDVRAMELDSTAWEALIQGEQEADTPATWMKNFEPIWMLVQGRQSTAAVHTQSPPSINLSDRLHAKRDALLAEQAQLQQAQQETDRAHTEALQQEAQKAARQAAMAAAQAAGAVAGQNAKESMQIIADDEEEQNVAEPPGGFVEYEY
ncbi:unnamed protein product [Symbiodinium microadriaticum]|nr:unnamed protein product [Symbiodinium microadriaticum]